jgi:hypothetical protein
MVKTDMTDEEVARQGRQGAAAINYEIIVTHGIAGAVGFVWLFGCRTRARPDVKSSIREDTCCE